MTQFRYEEAIPPCDIATKEVNGRRYYVGPNDILYPSVTTVISSLAKDGIKKWKKRVGEEYATRYVKRASDRGTTLHKVYEDYLLNKPNYLEDVMPYTKQLFNQLKKTVDQNVDVIYGVELPLLSPTLQTAGRTDLFCRYNGINTILDFKSSGKVKLEQWCTGYFIQATTYAMMIEERYNINIPQLAILIAVENDFPIIFVKKTKDFHEQVRSLFITNRPKGFEPIQLSSIENKV